MTAATTRPRRRRHFGLQATTWAVLLFLHFPIGIVALYAFTTESSAFTFPPPGLTLDWFQVAWDNGSVREALYLSVRVALTATAVALVLGTMAAAAVWRRPFFGPACNRPKRRRWLQSRQEMTTRVPPPPCPA